MAKVTLIIEDKGDEITLMGTVEPPSPPDKDFFTTAEVIGMYLQQHMRQILAQAIIWSRTPDTVEDAQLKEPSLIVLPGAQL
jgi:hypothetical protein